MRAMVIKYGHLFSETNEFLRDKMPMSMLAGLGALFIVTFAIVTLIRQFIDIDTIDRKQYEPDFKVGKKAMRLPNIARYCRFAPVGYIKWELRVERIQFIKNAWPILLLFLAILFFTPPLIMIKR